MKRSTWAKLAAIAATVLLLAIGLARIGFLVDERRERQQEAVQSVQRSHAGAQVVLGPWLHRSCVEEWRQEVGEGRERRLQPQRREFRLSVGPQSLQIRGQAMAESRYRGLFKVNGYLAELQWTARWPSLEALLPQPEVPGSQVSCGPVVAMVALSDPRGVQQAHLRAGGADLAVKAGTRHPAYAQGLHAVFEPESYAAPLELQAGLDVRGTARLDMVPAAAQTEWRLSSDWRHPSFGGRFLPVERQVDAQGFHAAWRVSELASSALADVAQDKRFCRVDATAAAMALVDDDGQVRHGADSADCLDTLGVAFVDPVNPYVLSDRAIKYGLLFVTLTFVAVALTEVLAGSRVRRVHPVQYALVGVALCLFFLLLLALSEHLAFPLAYGFASAACAAVMGVYTTHMLGGRRGGVAFAGGLSVLYGLMYVLLTREQTALVVGALGLFGALATVMMLTRRVDWYRLFDAPASSGTPGA